MTVTRLSPDADWNVAYAARTGGSTIHGVLSDASDATYIRRGSGNTNNVLAQVALSTATIPTTERIVTVVPGMRYLMAATDGKPCAVALAYFRPPPGPLAGLYTGPYTNYPKAETAREAEGYASSGRPLAPDNAPWSQYHIDGLIISVWDQHLATYANRAYVYELYADIATMKPATCDVTTPSGAVTDTSMPTVGISVSTVVDAWQTIPAPYMTGGQVQVRIFDEATYIAAGFDPATSVPLWEGTVRYDNPVYDDGVTPGTVAVSIASGAALPNSSDYRAYARATRDVPGGPVFYGAWAYEAFSIAITPPATPTTTCLNDDTARPPYVECNYDPGLTSPTFEFQRSIDDGATWQDFHGYSGESPEEEPALFDATCPRAIGVQYRSRVTVVESGLSLASEWSGACELDIDGDPIINKTTGWMFYAPIGEWWGTDLSVIGYPEESRTEDSGTFYPRGRALPVVVSGDQHGRDGSYEIETSIVAGVDETDCTGLSPGPVWVMDGFGTGKWIRILSPRSKVLKGTTAKPSATWTLSYVEIDPPV